jgi:hypothetical protein
MKNTFSGFDYNVLKVAVGVLGTLLFVVFPLPVILIFGNFWQRALIIYAFLFQLIIYWKLPGSKGKWWYGLMSVYGGIIMIFIMVKSAIVTIRHGGIYWRETFYSLKELRNVGK